MDLLEAHGRLAARTDRSVFPKLLVDSRDGRDMWPACLAGLASLSGWLEDARTEADLDEAIEHGLALYRMEVLDDETVSDAVNRVIAAVVLWGDNMVTMGGINAVN
jgi:hypothetical protein